MLGVHVYTRALLSTLASDAALVSNTTSQVPEGSRRKDYEESELVLYKHALLVGQGKIQEGAWFMTVEIGRAHV